MQSGGALTTTTRPRTPRYSHNRTRPSPRPRATMAATVQTRTPPTTLRLPPRTTMPATGPGRMKQKRLGMERGRAGAGRNRYDMTLSACDAANTTLAQAPRRERLTRPSDDLRRKCPLCFGGPRPNLQHTGYVIAAFAKSRADWVRRSHVIVCLDANFAQKRRKTAAQDAPVGFAGSRFATAAEVDEMEAEVDLKRKRPARRRAKGTSAKVDDEILDECEQSFTAAQEKVTKASKNYYSDTGVLAMLCRHDRVLYVVNMNTPGERQHYALTLLLKLMTELPDDWNVGVLYDIACQLSRSIEKVRAHVVPDARY